MTPSPPSAPNPLPSGDRSSWDKWMRIAIRGGGALLVLTLLGTVAARYFVYQRLGPIVETSVGNLIDRPVEIGPVSRFSLTGIALDGAAVPPTVEYEDYAKVPLVKVGYNPFRVLVDVVRDRSLPITLTFVDPEVYIPEDADGNWINLNIQRPEEEAPITLTLDTIKAENATLIVVPALNDGDNGADAARHTAVDPELTDPELAAQDVNDQEPESPNSVSPVVLSEVDAIAHLRNESRYLDVNVSGRAEGGGEFDLRGDVDFKHVQIKANLRSRAIQVAQFNDLINAFLPIPITVVEGDVNANLTVQYRDGDRPSANGTAEVTNLLAILDIAPEPITNLNSVLQFSGQTVSLEETSLDYGAVEVNASGTVDLRSGYALTAQIPPTTLDAIQESVNLDLPIETSGAIEAMVSVTGPLNRPRLQGTVRNRDPLQVDRLVANSLAAEFTLTPPLLTVNQLAITPEVGGEIRGNGQINLERGIGILFDVDVQELPTDAIAALYDLPLPDALQLGALNSTIELFGGATNLQATAEWALPNATYPSRGKVVYGDQVLRVRDTAIQVEQGTLNATATALLDQDQWNANVAIRDIDVQDFLPQSQGRLRTDVELSGRLSQLTPDAIALAGTATLADAALAFSPEGPPVLDPGDWDTAFRWTGTGLDIQRFAAPGLQANGSIETNLQGPITLDTLVTQLDLNVDVAPYELNRLYGFIPQTIRTRLDSQIAPYIGASLYPEGAVQFQGKLTGTLTQPQITGQTQLDNLAIASFQFAPSLTGPVQFGLGQGGILDLVGGGDRIYARLNERYLPSDFEIHNDEFVAEGTLNDQNRLVASIESLDLSRFGIQPLPRPDLGPMQGIVNLNVAANLAELSNPQVEGKVAIAQPGLGNIRAQAFTGNLSYRDGIATLDDGFFCLGPQRTPDQPTASVQSRPISESNLPTAPQPCEGRSQFYIATVVDVFEADIQSSQLTLDDVYVQDILATLQWAEFEDAIRWFDFNALTATSRPQGNAADVLADPVALPATPLIEKLDDSVVDQLDYFAQWLAQWERDTQMARQPLVVPPLQDLNGQLDGTLSLTGSPRAGFNAAFDVMGHQWTWGPYQQGVQIIAAGTYAPTAITLDPVRLTAAEASVAIEGDIGLNQSGASTLTVQNVPAPLIQDVAGQFVPALSSVPITVDGTLSTQATLTGTLFNPTLEGAVVLETPAINGQSLEQVDVAFDYDQAKLTMASEIVLQDQERLTFDGTIPYALPFMTVQPIDNRIALNANVRDEGLALITLFTDQVTWDGGSGSADISVSGTFSQPKILGTLAFQDGRVTSPFLSQPVTGLTGTVLFNLEHVIVPTLQAQLGSGTVAVRGQLPLLDASLAPLPDPTESPLVTETIPAKFPEEGVVITIADLPLNVRDLLTARVDGALAVNEAAIAPTISGALDVSNGRVDVANLANFRNPDTDTTNANDANDTDEEPVADRVNAAPGETVNRNDLFANANGNGANSGNALPFSQNPLLQRVTLDDLSVTLRDTLEIARRPFFDLATEGGFVVNGTLATPQVDGDIFLTSGWVNLFATQFRLDRNQDHVVRFEPDRAVTDPLLDISMSTTVREVERSPVPPSSPFARPEVLDQSAIPTFGGLQSVEITARVDGSTRHLLDHLADPNSPSPNPLTLTSNPNRSERQLVALLGGEIFTALESGNTGLALASYVGSGFVAGLGNQIANALGLSEFSIFPASDVSGESRLPITVGVEAGIDIIPRRLSFSVLEILDGTTNPQFGLRYRLSDRWQVRGSSDLNDDSRAILEFRNEF